MGFISHVGMLMLPKGKKPENLRVLQCVRQLEPLLTPRVSQK